MRRADQIQTLKTVMELANRVGQRGSFGRGDLLADAPEAIESWWTQLVRAWWIGCRGHDHDLLGARGRRLLEQPAERGRAIDQAMRLSAPIRIGRELHEPGIADAGNAESSGEHVGHERLH